MHPFRFHSKYFSFKQLKKQNGIHEVKCDGKFQYFTSRVAQLRCWCCDIMNVSKSKKYILY